MNEICEKFGWRWHEFDSLRELHDREQRVLAWISARPPYCDRGHWLGHTELVRDLDSQDGFPRYYMKLSVAMQEMTEFMAWRLHKHRVSDE